VINEKDALELKALIEVDRLNEMIEILLKAQNDFKVVSNIRSLFELVLLRLATSSGKSRSSEYVEVKDEKLASKPLLKPEEKIEPKPIEKSVEQKKESTEVKVVEPSPLVENNGSTVPSWLLEDEITIDEKIKPAIETKVKNKDSNTQDKCTINISGDKNAIDDETMIKIMVLGDKEERQTISKKWDDFNGLVAHPKYGLVASLLKDGRPYIVTKDVLVLEYDFDCLSDRINIVTNQSAIAELIKGILGREVFVYAIIRSEALRLQKSFFGLRQINKLPKAKDIVLNFKGENL
jgi:hypothetical protein